MKKSYRLAIVSVILIAAHVLVPVAAAHPLGNFTINHYAGLRVTRDAVAIDYVLDMAEIPAFQEISTFDANGNGQPDAAETAGYHSAKCDAIRSDLDLHMNGQPLALVQDSSAIEFPSGAGGLLTLRLTCAFRAAYVPAAENAGTPFRVRLEFKTNSYADRLGWREIVVTADGVSLQGDVASTSVSHRLSVYPDDLLSSPLDQREISFDFSLAAVPGQSPTPHSGAQAASNPSTPLRAGFQAPTPNRDDAFTQLIILQDLTPLTLLFALGVSFVWGALHALSPGHGKTVVAAYLVGTRGTARHAVTLGLTVTLTHTAGVFALGLVTLFASNYILPEQLYPWLSLASGLLVIGIGLTLLVTRYRAARSGRSLIPQLHAHADHHHAHHPHHDQGHVHDQQHDDHVHDHHHDHDHAHDHQHGDHVHDHHPADHAHDHGHTHDPYDANGRITLRSLLALGISGGLIPCPTALVVLLSAIALGRVGFGLMLIVAFSAGLAAVLMAIGLLFVQGRRLFDRIPAENRMLRLLPLAGAFLVIVTGVVMTAQAIASVGRLSV
ncbi:MAG: nickel/cobalt transporter [Anaerolineae bacterium]